MGKLIAAKMGNSIKYIIELPVILNKIVHWDGLAKCLAHFNWAIFIRITFYNIVIVSCTWKKAKEREVSVQQKMYTNNTQNLVLKS